MTLNIYMHFTFFFHHVTYALFIGPMLTIQLYVCVIRRPTDMYLIMYGVEGSTARSYYSLCIHFTWPGCWRHENMDCMDIRDSVGMNIAHQARNIFDQSYIKFVCLCDEVG